MQTPEEAFFFAGKPLEAALYEALMQRINETLPPYELRVQKTQITLVNPKVFACVSLKWKDCLTVTFGLPDRVVSPRIDQAAEVRPGRWTMHVKVYCPTEINAELMDWLGAAYAFAAHKH